jgi:hypothetical protein
MTEMRDLWNSLNKKSEFNYVPICKKALNGTRGNSI